MLAMSDIKSIKHLRNTKELSISKIAETFKINWRTAKKYADEEQRPQEKMVIRRGMMYEEKWGEIVSDWLFEDSKLRRKQRRTSKAIFLALKEIGFPGSYRTVCMFIAEWKSRRLSQEEYQSYERLEHPPGEAQLDFGLMEVVKDHQYVDVKVLVLSFPFSNVAFATALPAENTECFLHGLTQLFIQAEGVPTTLRIDNLPAAVTKPKRGGEKAELTDAFLRFQAAYGFEVQTCNPYSGNEKGHVENKVGYIRYNFFSVPPVMASYQSMSERLTQQLQKDRDRPHYRKGTTIEALWGEEKPHLLALPEEDYPIFTYDTAQVNKYGEIKLDQEWFRIPKGMKHKLVQVRKEWDRFTAYSPFGEELYHSPRAYMNKGKPIPWKDILHDWRIKPGSVLYSRHYKHLPVRVQAYFNVENIAKRKQRVEEILQLLSRYSMADIEERFYEITLLSHEQTEQNFDVDWQAYDALTPQRGTEAKG